MSERKNGDSATWKAISTLEWKKKQKAPAEPKGFGAILGEAQDAVAGKWSAAGNLVPTYLNRLSEIQIQDEAYIHQQLVKPDEVKPRRGLHHLLSSSKSRSGRGVRLLRGSGTGSRKVRFNEDPHGNKSSNSKGAASGASLGPYMAGNSAAASSKPGGNKGAAASTGGLKPSAIRFAVAGHGPGAAATSCDASLNAANEAAPDATNGSQLAGSSNSGTALQSSSSAANSVTLAASITIATAQQQSAAPTGTPRQQAPPPPHLASGKAGSSHPGRNSVDSSGMDGDSPAGSPPAMMALYLQQQSAEVAPETPSYGLGSSSGHWDGAMGKTDLVDKQLQRLRTAMAPPPPSQQEQPISPLGYRPLAISEEVFERWSVASTGSASIKASGTGLAAATAAAAAAVSGGADTIASSQSATRVLVGSSRPPSHTTLLEPAAAGGGGGAAGAAGQRISARRLSGTNIPGGQATDPQLLGSGKLARKNSRELLWMDAAAAGAGPVSAGGSGSCSASQRTARSSAEMITSSKQRRTTDYLTALSSIEASIHPRRTAGSISPSNRSGSASPMQHPSSPRGRSSNSSITTMSLPGALTGCGGSAGQLGSGLGVKGPRSTSSSLPDVSDMDLPRSPSPLRSAAAAAAGTAAYSSGSSAGAGSSAGVRGSRMAGETHNISSLQANAAAAAAAAHQHRTGSWSGSPPSSSGSISGSIQAAGAGSGSSELRHSTANQAAAGARKSSSKALYLPDISKPASKGLPSCMMMGKR